MHSPSSKMKYDELDEILTPEQIEIYAKKKEDFRKKAFVTE